MSFAATIDEAIIASQHATGALIVARAARDASSPIAWSAVSDALFHGAAFADRLKQATDMIKAEQPANDREAV